MYHVDEFGRDPALKSAHFRNAFVADQYIKQLKKVFATMSWAEFSDAKDDEDERQREAEKKRKNHEKKKINQEYNNYRKELVSKGLYELEEGEIIE
jgi:hypothetical protein